MNQALFCPVALQKVSPKNLGFDPVQVVRAAVRRGLVRISLVSTDVESIYRDKRRALTRRSMQRARLASRSRPPRKYVKHPELKGLPLEEYRRRLSAAAYQAKKLAVRRVA